MVVSQSTAYSRNRPVEIGDLSPHVEALLDMEAQNGKADTDEDQTSSIDDGTSTPADLIEKLIPEAMQKKPVSGSIFEELNSTFKEKPAAEVGEEIEQEKEAKKREKASASSGSDEESENPFGDATIMEPEITRSEEDETEQRSSAATFTDVSQMYDFLGIHDEPIGSGRPSLGPESPSLRQKVGGGKKGRPSATAPISEDSPEVEFARLLADVGITRGKIYITEQFFKKPSDGQWLNTVMMEAGISPNKRRMIIIGWFNDTPEALGIKINQATSASGEAADADSDVEKILEDVEKEDAKALKRLTVQKRTDEIRAELGLPTRGRRKGASVDEDDDLVEVPIKDSDGKFQKDINGNVITVKVTKKQLFWQNQEERSNSAPRQGSAQDKFFELILSQQKERAAEQRANDERFNKLIEQIHNTQKESRDNMIGYILKKEREENDSLRHAIKSKREVLEGVDEDIAVLSKLGLVRTDKATPLDQQTALVKESRDGFKDVYTLGRGDVKDILTMVREDLKEERMLRRPEMVADSKVNDKEKDDFYENLKKQIEEHEKATAKPAEKPKEVVNVLEGVPAIPVVAPPKPVEKPIENPEEKKDEVKVDDSSKVSQS
jgi:hypothetical protein